MQPELRNMHGMVRRTQNDTDVVLLFDYTDSEGVVTSRVTSPIRVNQSGESFLALCFSRERPSSFRFERCANMRIDKAHKYMMPWPLTILEVVSE
jgi:predicted DNA-binding transcriptional regulator YafY